MMSAASQKRRLLNADFTQGYRLKSAGARSGESDLCLETGFRWLRISSNDWHLWIR